MQILPNGNYIFRALEDQLKGNQDQHSKYHGMVVDYIMKHHLDFNSFIFLTNEINFEDYYKKGRRWNMTRPS